MRSIKKTTQENIYIIYRCSKAKLESLLYSLFAFFPMRRRQIVFCNYQGKQGYGDNPKAIAKALQEDQELDLDMVWLVNDTSKDFPVNIKVVKNSTIWRAYYLSTSGIWIENYRKSLEVRKKRGQLYISTWHGMIGFKKVGALRGSELPRIAEIVSRHDSSMVDYFLSNSTWSTNTIRKGFFYDGPILKTGSPRCDALVNYNQDQCIERLKALDLCKERRYMLYAPTFRGYDQNIHVNMQSKEFDFSPERICKSLQKRFGGQWCILYKKHPGTFDTSLAFQEEGEFLVELDGGQDLYDLLPICEGFISDYSSGVFDAANLRLPIFLFVDDLEEYEEKRGLLWNLEDLPFPVAQGEKQLMDCIENFDDISYQEGLDRLFEDVELLEDGNASRRVLEVIDKWLRKG